MSPHHLVVNLYLIYIPSYSKLPYLKINNLDSNRQTN